MSDKVAVVAIGRNEGDRLVRALAALAAQNLSPIVYVDSNSTDTSVEEARKIGAHVIELDMSVPFTAARARNAGWQAALEIAPDTEFIQFLDGDCELVDGWIDAALAAFAAEPDLAVACGRRRERFPDASRWNRMIDREWNSPIGEAIACGGDALMRRAAVEAVGGYREDLIAGEEPEMCFRMREKGWRIRRIDAEMTLHDADLTEFGQWWKRATRAGHAFAEGAFIHGKSPERFWVRQARRSLTWGALIPIVAILAALVITPWALLLLLIYPVQVLRLRFQQGQPWEEAIFLTLAKFAEAKGAFRFHHRRLTGQRKTLIEYK
jgi:glycosyltransferase involved in cell wall biosynthesis